MTTTFAGMLLIALLAPFSPAWAVFGDVRTETLAAAGDRRLDPQALEVIEALKVVLARLLDDAGKDPCPVEAKLTITLGEILCQQSTRNPYSELPNVWSLPASKFAGSPFALLTVGAGRAYLVYLPRVDGAVDMGTLQARGAIVDPATLRAANDKAGLAQGRKAIESLKERIRMEGWPTTP